MIFRIRIVLISLLFEAALTATSILISSLSVSFNINAYFSAIACHPDTNYLSVTCSISYSSFVNNAAHTEVVKNLPTQE